MYFRPLRTQGGGGDGGRSRFMAAGRGGGVGGVLRFGMPDGNVPVTGAWLSCCNDHAVSCDTCPFCFHGAMLCPRRGIRTTRPLPFGAPALSGGRLVRSRWGTTFCEGVELRVGCDATQEIFAWTTLFDALSGGCLVRTRRGSTCCEGVELRVGCDATQEICAWTTLCDATQGIFARTRLDTRGVWRQGARSICSILSSCTSSSPASGPSLYLCHHVLRVTNNSVSMSLATPPTDL